MYPKYGHFGMSKMCVSRIKKTAVNGVVKGGGTIQSHKKSANESALLLLVVVSTLEDEG